MQVFTCIILCMADEADRVFKALADPARRYLLDSLRERNGQTLGELCDQLDMARQSASQHIAILAAANLVSTVWRGREKLHYLNPADLRIRHLHPGNGAERVARVDRRRPDRTVLGPQ